MDFPIVDLLDEHKARSWILAHFHPHGLKCSHCSASVTEARQFRKTAKSQLTVYRCRLCQGVYNLYSGTVFEGRSLTPAQVVLVLRGVCKGQPSAEIGREISLTRQTVLSIRREIQTRAEKIVPQSTLTDSQTETDEMFQNAGEKRNPSPRQDRPTPATSQ
jgi:transposase-like protein